MNELDQGSAHALAFIGALSFALVTFFLNELWERFRNR